MKLWDPIRKKWVESTPEERVRQNLLVEMVERLGFPPPLISVEKQVAGSRKRYDFVVVTPKGDTLSPLLLVECKASFLSREAFRQAVGYNFFVQAPFLCLASKMGVETFWKEGEELRSAPRFFSYRELLEGFCRSI